MLDQLDRELAPIDRALQSFARRQPGCRALTGRLYGVGAVTATAILAELGDARRFKSSDDASATAASTSPSGSPTASVLPATSLTRGGALALGVVRGGPVRRPPLLTRPRLLPAGREPDRPQPRLPLSRAQTLPPRPPHPPRTRRRRTRADRSVDQNAARRRSRLTDPVRAPLIRPMPLRPAPAMLPSPPPTTHDPRAWPASIDRAAATTPRETPNQSSRRRSDPRT